MEKRTQCFVTRRKKKIKKTKSLSNKKISDVFQGPRQVRARGGTGKKSRLGGKGGGGRRNQKETRGFVPREKRGTPGGGGIKTRNKKQTWKSLTVGGGKQGTENPLTKRNRFGRSAMGGKKTHEKKRVITKD